MQSRIVCPESYVVGKRVIIHAFIITSEPGRVGPVEVA
jgi:hypothetical protein